MDNWAKELSENLNTMAMDIAKLVDNEKKKASAKKGESVKEKDPKSLQRLTTFHSSIEEAKEMSEEENPAIVFINKRMKEIFGE